MPWLDGRKLMERMTFVRDFATGLYTLSELAAQYQVSRPTAYKWLARYHADGETGLEELPRAARHVANRTAPELEQRLVELRRRYHTWGPKKLLAFLKREVDADSLPSRSTAAAILKRHGLVSTRKRRRREGHPGRPVTQPTAPNDIWAGDFKGQFLTRDGRYCYPFTVTDLHSRYLICCDGYLTTNSEGVQRSLERVFREYGLPLAFRTDNGAPFASTGIARLTTLGVWLLKLGIRRELIQPARPYQNGSHERMHRTLEAEATHPRAQNAKRQQATFETFRTEFNEIRPHEALEMKTPASIYKPSPRVFPNRLAEPEYPGHFEIRKVSRNGGIRWNSAWLPVGHALIEENIGLEQIADGVWDVYFTAQRIGRFDEREMRLVGTLATHYRAGRKGHHPQDGRPPAQR